MKNGAPEGILHVLAAMSLPAVSLKALNATSSMNKQGENCVWNEAEPAKGGGKTVYP